VLAALEDVTERRRRGRAFRVRDPDPDGKVVFGFPDLRIFLV
jgi:hypothetical protein